MRMGSLSNRAKRAQRRSNPHFAYRCALALPCHGRGPRQIEGHHRTGAALTRLLLLDTLVDGAIHREWIVAIGRRSKTSHLAHLICELVERLQVVKRTSGHDFQPASFASRNG